MALARGREGAEWQRWLPAFRGLTDLQPAEILPAWLREDEVRTPAPEPSEGDKRRGLLLMGRMLGMGEPPEGW